VHVYDFGAVSDDDGVTLYLAMELVRGVDLRALILRALAEAKRAGRAGAIPPHHSAKIASFVCEALAHAHTLRIDGRPAGIVHRDVTPSNVLVSFDGAVKLADFGIAKAATTAGDRTEHGIVKGKHTYLSPEQARGEPLDARSDLFNVGILIFESALGEALFPPSDQRLARKLSASGQLARVERFERIPPALRAIALKALSPAREDRYPDALALRSDLEAYLRACPEPSDTVEIGRFVRQMCAEELSEDALGPRAAGTVASRQQAGTVPLTAGIVEGGQGGTSASPRAILEQIERDAGAAVPTSLGSPRGVVRRAAAAAFLRNTSIEPTRAGGSAPPNDEGTTHPNVTAVDAAPADLGSSSHALASAAGADSGQARAPLPGATTARVRQRGVPPAAGTTPIVRSPLSRWPWIALAAAIVSLASAAAIAVVVIDDDEDARASLPRLASLEVTSAPSGARLFVDGVEHGLTPTFVTSIMPGRAVRLEVRASSGDVLDTAELELREGETRAVRMNAAPPAGLVRVSSEPSGATVEIDGVGVGATPLEREVPLGAHRVRVALAGHAAQEQVAILEQGGDHASVSFALRPVVASVRPEPRRGSAARDPARGEPAFAAGTGTLRASTDPWSDVFEGSRHLGDTPLQIELPVGRHVLTFRAEGRPAREETVEIRAGEVTRVRPVL
jgi:serine/threonine-protein kinase